MVDCGFNPRTEDFATGVVPAVSKWRRLVKRIQHLMVASLTVLLTGCLTSRHVTHPGAPEPDVWRVRLNWQTETELNAFGFYIHRADALDGPMTVLNPDAPVHAAGTTTIPQRYRYYDLEVEAGKTYYYKLEQVDIDGSSRFIIGADQPVPGESKLLSVDEAEEIRAHGTKYREEAG